MKKIFFIIVIFLLVFPTFIFAEEPIKLYVDGKKIESDVDIFIKDGKTFVPVRFIGETLGMEISFDNSDVDFGPYIYMKSKNKTNICILGIGIFSMDRSIFFGDGGNENLIKNNRTFVPIRFIANALHMDITYDKNNNSVNLTTNKKSEVYPIYINIEDKAENKEILISEYSLKYENNQYFIIDNTTQKSIPFDSFFKIFEEDSKLTKKYNDYIKKTYNIDNSFYGISFLEMNFDRTKISGISGG